MSEMDELKIVFMEEVLDLIEKIRDDLEDYLTADDKLQRMQSIWRALHTIKGSAGTVEYHQIQERAHKLETQLLKFKDHPEKLTAKHISTISHVLDKFENLLEEEHSPQTPKNQAGTAFGVFDEDEAKSKTNEAPPPQPSKSVPASELVRVPLDRIQQNLDVISELFLIGNQLKYLVQSFRNQEIAQDTFFQNWEILDNSRRKSISELEHIAMSMRMAPIKGLFRRMEKTIRGYATKVNKNIQIKFSGEETELDKKILDTLSEPLIHLTRNAMDHGIEDDQERTDLGKPIPATIRFDASVEGNEVVIKVSDDGRGINGKKVLESAKRKGLQVGQIVDLDEAVQLIFMPGFSTKEKATDISGRGVGMDAVKTYVESFGGTIAVETKVGSGSLFTLRLPVGLSVVPVLIAKSNNTVYAIPSSDIIETKKVNSELFVKNGEAEFFNHRGEFIPCFDLDEILFNIRSEHHLPQLKKKKISICLIKFRNRLISLKMHDTLYNTEVAVKAMPDQGARIPYINGVSILATGEPVFTLSLKKVYETRIHPRMKDEVAYGVA